MANLTLDRATSYKDPALQNRWFAVLPDGDGSIFIEAASPTFPKIDSGPRFYGGSNTYYPLIADIDGISLTLYETDQFNAHKYAIEWIRQVFDPVTLTYGLPSEYKRDITFEYYPLIDESVKLKATYLGLWPSDISPPELSYEQPDGRVVCSMNLSCDDVRFKWEGGGDG